MSDINDIGRALDSARRAVFSLASWVNSADAYDAVQGLTISIEREISAYGRLECDIHNGRKHIKTPDDYEDYEETSCGCKNPGAMPPCLYCTERDDESTAEAVSQKEAE